VTATCGAGGLVPPCLSIKFSHRGTAPFCLPVRGSAAATGAGRPACVPQRRRRIRNALEPDKRCPDSQPVDAEVALGNLDLVGAADDPMVSGLCDWLDAVADVSGASVPSTRRSCSISTLRATSTHRWTGRLRRVASDIACSAARIPWRVSRPCAGQSRTTAAGQ